VHAARTKHGLGIKDVEAALPKKDNGKPLHHFTWVSKVERGEVDVSLSDIDALAAAVRSTPGWLIEGDLREAEFLSEIRAAYAQGEGLDSYAERTITELTWQQVEQTQLRRTARELTAEDAQLLRDFHAAPEALRQAIAQSLREGTGRTGQSPSPALEDA
jgi:hypothetical protein